MRTVVLNCANIGCVYAETRARTERRPARDGAFEWEGVRKAIEYYEERGVTPQGVCKRQTHEVTPLPPDLRHKVVLPPPHDDQASIDDLFTIRVAMKYGCQLVDNDNYRDWKAGAGGEDVRRWLYGAGASLKVTFMFDRYGTFVPNLDPLA